MISALVMAAAMALQPAGAEPPMRQPVTRDDARWLMSQGDIGERDFYRDANRALLATAPDRARIILLGDSLTFHWPGEALPELPDAEIINRGIPGQVTTQMLLRFEDDVVALDPAVVVILAGTNDLRGLAGLEREPTEAAIRLAASNLTAMSDIADARHIRVILCAVPPVDRHQAVMSRDPAAIVATNAWLRGFAADRGYAFLDYHAALAVSDGSIRSDFTSDGLHLSRTGYLRLKSALESALRAALDD